MREAPDSPTPPAQAPGRRRSRPWQWWVVVAFLSFLLAVAGALAWLDTPSGHRFLVSRIARIAPQSGLRIDVGSIEGSIYSKARLRDLRLSDPDGAFFTAPRVDLHWWPFAWAYGRLDIDRLILPEATLLKLPKLRPSEREGPILPDFDIRLMEFSIGRLKMAKGITGREQVMTLRGDADIRSGRAIIDLSAHSMTGADAFLLALDSRPDDDRFDVDVTVNAPRGGVIATIAGLTQDANLRIDGNGSWTQWKGAALGTLDGKPAIALRLAARSGQYSLEGSIEGAAIAGTGLVQRLTAPRLDLAGRGTFEKRLLDGELSVKSPAITLNADGAFDLGKSAFDNLLIDLRLTRPDALLRNMTGRDVMARVRLDGPMASVGFEYLLAARQLAFGKTVLSDVRADGKGRRAAGGPAVIPVRLSARRLDGQGALVEGILRNFTLSGALQLADQKIVSTPLKVRADKLDGELVLIAELRTGRYDIGLSGDIRGLLIPGLGVVDVRSKIRAVPGANGAFTLKGDAEAVMRRLDNSFFRGLGGGLPRLRSGLSLGPDGRLMLDGLRLDSPLLRLTANGYRRPDGSFHFEGGGAHDQYGPLRLILDGKIEQPAIRLVLARPLDAAGLRDVLVELDPNAAGYAFTARGGSTLGPFEGNGQIALPSGRAATIDVQRLVVSGTVSQGIITPVAGGLAGRVAVTGAVTGFVDLAMVDGLQRLAAELNAADARFNGPSPIVVRQGKLTATMLLDPAGASIDATLQARGVQMGPLRIGRIAANTRLVDGRGIARASLSAPRGGLFELQMEAGIAPGRVALMANGTLDRRPLNIVRRAVFTQTDDGWRLAPATIRYAGGSIQLAGNLGGESTSIEARLQKLPMSLHNILYEDMGLGGTASGTVSYAWPRNGAPAGQANLRVRGLTRSGLSLSSKPIDLGVNAVLTADRLAARATVVSEGRTIGRAQALLTPLGSGSLMQRFEEAPLFGQLRYNGTADTLWRLTGIEIIDLSGPVAVAADMRGTLINPVISGSLSSDNAAINSPITGMRLTGVKARGRFSGSQLVISQFSGTARGGGTVTGTGRFEFAGARGVGIDLSAQASNAALLARDDIAATVTGPITIRSDGNGGVVGGDVVLNSSRFTLGRAAAVAEIPELRVIETNRRGEEFERVAPAAPWRLDLRANAPQRLMVDGLGLSSEWSARLQIGGTVNNPTILGTAELVRGGYEFAGRRFELTEGTIRFNGRTPVDPTLDIEAEADVNDLSATIRVTGTGLKPIITFSSVPALPEDELLSRILFGTSITNLSAPEALQLAAAVAALQGGGGGLDPINAVRKATGLDRLRILPADPLVGQGTSVAAGKYLSRRTYVELITDGQGYSATRIEYQVTRWLSLLASVSTIGRQSANVRVSKDY